MSQAKGVAQLMQRHAEQIGVGADVPAFRVVNLPLPLFCHLLAP